VLRDFAHTHPAVLAEPARRLALPYSPDVYYADPARHAVELYQHFVSQTDLQSQSSR